MNAVEVFLQRGLFQKRHGGRRKGQWGRPQDQPRKTNQDKAHEPNGSTRLKKDALSAPASLLDGAPAHNGLQGRETKHACRVTLVIGAGCSDDGGSAVLNVDDHDIPHRPDLAAVGQFYWSEETELFFPVFSFLIPHQSPVSIKSGLVEVQQLSRIAVAWIFGGDLENMCVDHLPLFVQ